MKIRRGDSVVVISGDSSTDDTPHKVIQVNHDSGQLVVEGINRVYKHVRRGHPKSPQGGRLNLEMAIDASNVAYYCETCSKGTRLGYRYREDGSKERYCRKCGSEAGPVSGPKARYAQS